MLFLKKLFLLAASFLSEPFVEALQKAHQRSLLIGRRSRMTSFFAWLGHRRYRMEIRMDRMMNRKRYGPEEKIESLEPNEAVAKGFEFFYEVFIGYGLLFLFPVYELWQSHKEGKESAADLDNRLQSIEERFDNIQKRLELISSDISRLSHALQQPTSS
eukprot:TRINITY_DN7594_c3_g5_i1.p1 TRINITY_DN7594_c3_g5~~TRINITY_DN7594_c3_g5_i1.p1  ORF type:complete len:159 (+),score=19.50 TRINITY_DN7594_c3_g5_i1:50-526(+)